MKNCCSDCDLLVVCDRQAAICAAVGRAPEVPETLLKSWIQGHSWRRPLLTKASWMQVHSWRRPSSPIYPGWGVLLDASA